MIEQLFDVRLETVSLAKGATEERRMMTERQLAEWLKSVHSSAKVGESPAWRRGAIRGE